MLVATHCNDFPDLAAGRATLPDTAASFRQTRALRQFLGNERMTPALLGQPPIEAAREVIRGSCHDFSLAAHDWSQLNYDRHTPKQDRLQMTHATDVGYELKTSLVIFNRFGRITEPDSQEPENGQHGVECKPFGCRTQAVGVVLLRSTIPTPT